MVSRGSVYSPRLDACSRFDNAVLLKLQSVPFLPKNRSAQPRQIDLIRFSEFLGHVAFTEVAMKLIIGK